MFNDKVQVDMSVSPAGILERLNERRGGGGTD
jgi:hypothetical protein